MKANKYHIINGMGCTDKECWCFKFLKNDADIVNHPQHYALDLDSGVSVEVLEIIKASLTEEQFIGYLIGNNIKYLLRHNKKNGVEDIKKMCFYARELNNVC